ncbi:MAG: hypothetical protein AB4368_22060 [Xenococcaceae cyanobacterium]
MLDSLININQDHSTCQEPDINIELYSSGFFDGVCGLDATPKEKLDKIGQPSLVIGLGLLIIR